MAEIKLTRDEALHLIAHGRDGSPKFDQFAEANKMDYELILKLFRFARQAVIEGASSIVVRATSRKVSFHAYK